MVESITRVELLLLLSLNELVGVFRPIDWGLQFLLGAHLFKMAPLMAMLCYLWFSRVPPAIERRQVVVSTIFAGLLSLALARLLVHGLPFRPRPFARPELGLAMPHEMAGLEAVLGTWSAFPSDHALLAFALAAGIARLSWPLGLLAFLHAALVVSFPRLALGLHYPSDVIVGGAFGVLVAVVCTTPAVSRRLGGPVLLLERRAPGAFAAAGFLVIYSIATMFDDLRVVGGVMVITLLKLIQ